MKKTILITLGALILIIIVGIWIYLFMYGAPKNSSEVFARFGIGDEGAPPALIGTENTQAEENSLPEAEKNLRQLTLRPVAGATFTGTGILYVEQGTGHVYHINFSSGSETLISGTTIPKTREAVFSQGGTYVAITSIRDSVSETVVGSVTLENGSGGLEGVSLPVGAKEIYFGNATNTLMYALSNSLGTTGYSYDIETTKGTQLFTIPLRDVRVLWGTPHYVYTTPTATQEGHLYKVLKDDLIYVTSGSAGLMSLSYSGGVVVTKKNGENISSYAITGSGDEREVPVPLIPEKCAHGETFLYCASPYDIPSKNSFPDNWYKGSLSLVDVLWSVDVGEGEATLLSDILSESGREVDVRTIGANEDGTYIYFINKNDNTLWMFETTV